MIGPKYQAYTAAKKRREDAQAWLDHIGKKSIDTPDVLSLSTSHSRLELTIAGQLSRSGDNYRNAPKGFTDAMLEIIHESFSHMAVATMQKLAAAETTAMIEAEGEVQSALDAIHAAKEKKG